MGRQDGFGLLRDMGQNILGQVDLKAHFVHNQLMCQILLKNIISIVIVLFEYNDLVDLVH